MDRPPTGSGTGPEWRISEGLVPYEEALATMEARVADIHAGRARELVWLLEHPPLYTAGTSSQARDLLEPARFAVHVAGRGGQYTYHGPGQRVMYLMLDLRKRGRDVRRFVCDVEAVIIDTLAAFGVIGERRPGRVGVWVVEADGREDKIAAVGVRLRHWVSFHGASLNVAPDLTHYDGIVPCGIREHGVTSLAALSATSEMAAVDAELRRSFERHFGATVETTEPIGGAGAMRSAAL